MDFQLRLGMEKFTSSLSLMKKLPGQDRLPEAAVFNQKCQTPPYCAICLNDVCGGDSYRKLPECGHCFHADCIDLWFKTHSTCPLCRSQVPQIISLNENHNQLADLISNIVLLFHNFVDKMCNPLNDELASLLCDNVRCIS